jgi:lysophospholipase L1-like esterase
VKRRTFVATTGVALGATLAPGMLHAGNESGDSGMNILFQGDSITDCGRNRQSTAANAADALGTGYPLLISSALLAANPGAGYRFFNRGVSGNTVPDCDARWQTDTIDLKPDVLSFLIGVNDYWHTLNGSYTGTAADFERQYRALLARTRTALPAVRIVVLEPFTLRTGAVTDAWFPAFDERRAIARRVAEGAGAAFIATQAMFDGLTKTTPPSYWTADGVHPTAAGHGAIARVWMDAVKL